jgi:hypothetical protein
VLGYIALPAVHNTEPTEQQNQGILHTHSEPSATFNMNHMLLVTLDSNKNVLIIDIERPLRSLECVVRMGIRSEWIA